MPITRISRLGWPKNSAASHASARRASLTTSHGAGVEVGAARSATIGAAPAAIAWAANWTPSAFSPRSATNTHPASTRRESWVTPRHGVAIARAAGGTSGRWSGGIARAQAANNSPTVMTVAIQPERRDRPAFDGTAGGGFLLHD